MTGAPSIGDYAIIGDCRSAALISRDGALDWLCWPRFDSPAVFAGLLDVDRGGRWRITPQDACRTTRRYLPDTNVLETLFATHAGVLTSTDFMPLTDDLYGRCHLSPDHHIIRLLRCESGRVDVDVTFAPRPNFGAGVTRIVDRGRLGLRVSSGHGMLSLHANTAFEIERGTATARVTMEAGDEIPFVLTYSEASPEVLPILDQSADALERTVLWWQCWLASNEYDGPHADAVRRSILTLKLLEYPASGAFVAAPTTSLPERIGGELNWDYRYCWLRDAAFIMEALCGTGFVPEAEAFAEWLLHATRLTQPKLMVMYDLDGNPAPGERPLNHLAGHRGSTPVRLGNAARSQSQLDTYGEVVSGVAKLLKHIGKPADRETSKVLVGFGRYVCEHWQEPDAGIWEPRDDPVVHTHSRLLAWAALDALIDLDRHALVRGVPVLTFSSTRDALRRAIESECWCERLSSYTSEPAASKLDATLLLMAIHGFHDASNDRMRKTHAAVFRRLGAGGPLLYRNLPDDGTPVEGAFGICGFWRAHFLALGGGSLEEAEAAFIELLRTGNDVGLFGEETDPASGDILGNFPQAFTHVGLINAALAIERRRTRAKAGPA